MDNKTKETIKGIKYNYIALNILLISMFIFLLTLFVTNNIQLKRLAEKSLIDKNEITNLKQELSEAKNTILDKIDEQSQNTNNNIIVSIYQNEDIKQKLDNIMNSRDRY